MVKYHSDVELFLLRHVTVLLATEYDSDITGCFVGESFYVEGFCCLVWSCHQIFIVGTLDLWGFRNHTPEDISPLWTRLNVPADNHLFKYCYA